MQPLVDLQRRRLCAQAQAVHGLQAHRAIGPRAAACAAQRLLRVRGAQQWLVLLSDTEATQETVQRIRGILPPNAYAVTTWEDDADFYRKTAELFARQFGFVRIVIAIVIVLSILNTMTMSVLSTTPNSRLKGRP